MPLGDREALLFDLGMALRKVPAGIWRDLDQHRLSGGDLAETVAAEQILEHLLRCGWRVERTPPAGTPAAG